MSFEDFNSLLEKDIGKSQVIIEDDKPLIVIIDDDPNILEDLVFALQKHYQIRTFLKAKEGVKYINHEVKAVILDIKMPDQDGFVTFEQIKQKYIHLPIIFYSAYQDLKDPYQVINNYRPFGYISKGENLRPLLDGIANAIDYSHKWQENKDLIQRLKSLLTTSREIAGNHEPLEIISLAMNTMLQEIPFQKEYEILFYFNPSGSVENQKFEHYSLKSSAINKAQKHINLCNFIKSDSVNEKDLITILEKIDHFQGCFLVSGTLYVPLQRRDIFYGTVQINGVQVQHSRKEIEDYLNILLQSLMVALESAKLYENQERLVAERTIELSSALENLKAAQKQLVEKEKMASLGGLVAGISHEINTPLGVGVTAASFLNQKLSKFKDEFLLGNIKKSTFSNFIDITMESSSIVMSNLRSVSDLVQKFKNIAVDLSHVSLKEFNIYECFEKIINGLSSEIEKHNHKIDIQCNKELALENYPREFIQIFSNLIMNSIVHGYENQKNGNLKIAVSQDQLQTRFIYSDDGKGIPKEFLKKIFDPFFTIRRNQGDTGLGLHIVYNIVSHKMGGDIHCESEVGKGSQFIINLPNQFEEISSSQVVG
jgi:signal transduction histidine kinase/FixJ family two-component response regulator